MYISFEELFTKKAIIIGVLAVTLAKIPSYGQEKFREGYVITLQQDTLRGLIDYKTASKSAIKCRFKNSQESKVVTYAPDEIAGYRFTPGKYYVSKQVKIDEQDKTVFLEYLIDGIADIFFCRDGNDDHYYIMKEDNQLVPLTIESVEINRDGRNYMKHKEYYKGTLRYIFSDAPALSNKIETTSLSHADLIDIAEEYHNQVCDEYKCITYSRQKTPIQIRVGMLGGSSISRISFKNVEYLQDQMEASFSNSTNVTFGAFVQFKDPFLSEYISFQTEAWYGNSSYTTDELALSYSYFKIPAMVRYTSINRKVRPILALGPVATFLIDLETKRFNSDETRSWLDGSTLMGVEGVIGLNYVLNKRNSIFLEARYNVNFGAHQNQNKFLLPSTTRGYVILQDNFNTKISFLNVVTGFSF
ncbi:MAG: outer membrane beta-barrel protein [Cyclobacteriaceae bacterium]